MNASEVQPLKFDLISDLIDFVKVLHPTPHKTGDFGHVLPSQSLG